MEYFTLFADLKTLQKAEKNGIIKTPIKKWKNTGNMFVSCPFMFILPFENVFLSIFQTYIDKNKNICYNNVKE